MSDWSELKAKAEALIAYDAQPNDGHTGYSEIYAPAAWHDLHDALEPETVLALIAENGASKERADAEQDAFDGQRRILDTIKAEREQLKTEVATLRAGLIQNRTYVLSTEHGKNCFVGYHVDGEPCNCCHCGKDGAFAQIKAALDAEGAPSD